MGQVQPRVMIVRTHSSHQASFLLILFVVLSLMYLTACTIASRVPGLHDDADAHIGILDAPAHSPEDMSSSYHHQKRPSGRIGQLQFPSSESIPQSILAHDSKRKGKMFGIWSNRDTLLSESTFTSGNFSVPDVDRRLFVRGWNRNDNVLARGNPGNIVHHGKLWGSLSKRSGRGLDSYSSETTTKTHENTMENVGRETHPRQNMQTSIFRTNEQTQLRSPQKLMEHSHQGLANVAPPNANRLLHCQRSSRSHDHSSSKSNSSLLPIHKRTSVQYSSLVGPSFLNASYHSQVRAVAGQTAVLACIIKNLHNFTVSWVRARDINLLTADLNTYSSDSRFVASNPGSGPRWQLKIHHARLTDGGTYLCQVSATPPITTPVALTVTEANVSVEPAREVFVKVGSPVLLTCTVTGCPAPVLPMWYKGNKLLEGTIVREEDVNTPTSISDSGNAPQNTTSIEKTSSSDELPEDATEDDGNQQEFFLLYRWRKTTVVFERAEATVQHSGLYTCTNTCTPAANITLHVLLEEETAAMQHINSGPHSKPGSWSSVLLSLLLALQSTAGSSLLIELCPYSSQRIRRKVSSLF